MDTAELPPFSDPKLWIAVLALMVSIVSVFLAVRSGRTARRALAISEAQENRRQPQLKISYDNGYRRLVAGRQLFGFLVSIANPSDINNSVARAELKITYVTQNDLTAFFRIQHNPTLGEMVTVEGSSPALALPLRIDAHQAVSGWLLFALDNDAIHKSTVDAHCLILEDTHGVPTETNPIMVREWTDETKRG